MLEWARNWKGGSSMPKKTFTTEQIINKLRKAEVMAAQGHTVPAIC